MSPEHCVFLCLGVLAVAFLYSSVGHAGASGYIAVMTLAGLSPGFIKPTALTLNILVACFSFLQFYRAGHFSWSLFWPFALFAIPLAFVGGHVNLPVHGFTILVGIVLLCSAARFLITPKPDGGFRRPSVGVSLCVGGTLGCLADLTGTGGGVFLSPLLISLQWARTKTAAATAAAFILVNSISGLLGSVSSTRSLPPVVMPLVIAAATGGAVGSYLGSRRFSAVVIKRFLACVLTIAGLKLIFT